MDVVGSVGETQPQKYRPREDDGRQEGENKHHQKGGPEDNQVDRRKSLPELWWQIFLKEV